MIELTDEELRTARLWCGFCLCVNELRKQGARVPFDFGGENAFKEFVNSELGKRVVGLGLPHDQWNEHMDWLAAMVSEPVREALGIKKI